MNKADIEKKLQSGSKIDNSTLYELIQSHPILWDAFNECLEVIFKRVKPNAFRSKCFKREITRKLIKDYMLRYILSNSGSNSNYFKTCLYIYSNNNSIEESFISYDFQVVRWLKLQKIISII